MSAATAAAMASACSGAIEKERSTERHVKDYSCEHGVYTLLLCRSKSECFDEGKDERRKKNNKSLECPVLLIVCLFFVVEFRILNPNPSPNSNPSSFATKWRDRTVLLTKTLRSTLWFAHTPKFKHMQNISSKIMRCACIHYKPSGVIKS